MAEKRSRIGGLRASIYSRTILFAFVLILVTAGGLVAVLVQAVNARVERNADERLQDGVSYFRSSLEDEAQTLFAVGSILSSDPTFIAAVQAGNGPGIQEWLRLTVREPVDEALLVATDGKVLQGVAALGSAPAAVDSAGQGFRQALVGQTTANWVFDGLLKQELDVPIQLTGDRNLVLRLSAVIDESELDRFRARTGLDASLFRGDSRLATTLRDPSGQPANAAVLQDALDQIVNKQAELVRGVSLPGTSMRSDFAPLRAADGSVVATFAVSMPLSAVLGEFRSALWPAVPLTVIVLALGLLAAFWLTRRLTQPLLLLADSAARMRAGDLSTPVPTIREPEFEPLRDELEQARHNMQASLQAVTKQEATERALFAAVRDPVLVTSDEGIVNLFNAAAAAWFGGAFRLSNRHVEEVLPFLPNTAVAQGEGVWQGTVSTDRGRQVDLEAVKNTIDVDGSAPMHVYVVHDISQHAELNRLREQLLYDVAHELRGPMGILDNALDIVATDYGSLSTEEFESLMGSARRTVTRLHQLMEDLLGAGSIQAGRFEVDPKPTELGTVISAAVEAVEPLLQTRNHSLDTSQAEEAVMILADRRYIRNALVNLLTNAAKYSPDGSAIRIVTNRANNEVRIAVIDSGPGMTPDEQTGLFDRFYRARPREQRGIGLGLAIVKGIVEAHGGNVGVSSQPGAGSEFWFSLPLAKTARRQMVKAVDVSRS